MLRNSRRKFVTETCKYFLLLMVTRLGHVQAGETTNRKQSGRAVARSSIERKVINVVVYNLGVCREKVTARARFVEDLGADSLDMTELVMAFEEAFCINIPDEDAAKICTVQNAVDYICDHARHRVSPCPHYKSGHP